MVRRTGAGWADFHLGYYPLGYGLLIHNLLYLRLTQDAGRTKVEPSVGRSAPPQRLPQRCRLLELKRIHILGFKSFCDRTEVLLDSNGLTAIVGPNGCGKSNISDAISWVLGEQSAKDLRGIKMEDVIFSGTRERKPTGMAEVSLVLIDPEVYRPASVHHGPEIVEGDWDEAAVRSEAAKETEEITAELQPGQILEEPAEVDGNSSAQPEATAGTAGENKIGRAHV